MQSNKRWTLLELLNTTTQYFDEKNIDNPRLNAEELLGKALGLNRVQLYVAFERPVTDTEVDSFRSMVKRRAQHEPLQHIIGMTEFMGFPIQVNRDVLIARPETEILVEEVINLKNQNDLKNPNILDIGTGSGCIAISLALCLLESKILATDISPAAIEIAQQNCRLNKISVQIIESNQTQKIDFTTPVTLVEHDIMQPWAQSLRNQFDIIVSNPPYVTQTEMDSLQPEVKDFEPHAALTDFSDGLKFYKRIFDLIMGNNELKCRYLLLEMSGSQPEKITAIAQNYPFNKLDIIPDLNKIDRVLRIEV